MKVKGENGQIKDINVFFEKGEVSEKGGKPKKILTPEALKVIEAWSRFHATDTEIAGALGCCRDVFYTEENKEVYRQAKEKGQSEGLLSLRRKQFELAMNGNWHMLQWCGIQLLKQSDKLDVNAQVNADENAKLVQEYLDEIKKGKDNE